LSDESLFREVDEEVRQEQFKKLWARYGNLITVLAVLAVLIVAGFQGWKYWQLKQSETAGAGYFDAATLADNNKADEALKQFSAIDHPGYGMLARMREAGLLAAQGKTAEAVKAFDAVAADGKADPAIRDLARIRAALLLADTTAPADLAKRLDGFDVPGNPWRHAAREAMAISAFKVKDYAAADKQVQAMLTDTETPGDMRQRATMMSDLLLPLLPAK
jgi:hypothetical protein